MFLSVKLIGPVVGQWFNQSPRFGLQIQNAGHYVLAALDSSGTNFYAVIFLNLAEICQHRFDSNFQVSSFSSKEHFVDVDDDVDDSVGYLILHIKLNQFKQSTTKVIFCFAVPVKRSDLIVSTLFKIFFYHKKVSIDPEFCSKFRSDHVSNISRRLHNRRKSRCCSLQ